MQHSIIGQTVSHYHIVAKLGEGGMGIVYKAEDTKLHRHVALKFLPAKVGSDSAEKQRFIHEARAASALDHPNICTVHDVDETEDGQMFMVMALYEGETLKERIARAPLSVEEALEITQQLATALAKAHDAGIVHRDIKPANVIITSDGIAKILDFGLAKLHGHTKITRTGTTLGTVAYMSPEQARGDEVDHRTDIWSLGVVLHEMLSGETPFRADHPEALLYAIIHEQPWPLVPRRQSISTRPDDPTMSWKDTDGKAAEDTAALSPSVAELVRSALVKDPSARLQSMEAFRREVTSRLEELRGERIAPPGRRLRRALRSPSVIALLILFSALATTASIWFYRDYTRKQWVRETALPQLEELANRIPLFDRGRDAFDAFMLARRIEAITPDDPILARLLPRFTTEISILSDPPGATVVFRPYDDLESEPVLLGVTPLEKVRYPNSLTRIRLEVEGRVPVEDVTWALDKVSGVSNTYRLAVPGELPDTMTLVPGGSPELLMGGLSGGSRVGVPAASDFLMDRHEVTNREYKEFVDAGGYADRRYWAEPFIEDGRRLDWVEAMSRLVDRTGLPGPATWEVGTYPEGRGDYPVSGVSWYEAAAYARWAGKELPTIYHWNRVAYLEGIEKMLPMANMGNGPVPVGSTEALNRFGVYDLLGNVREWCWNETDQGRGRFALGAAWSDEYYAAPAAVWRSPFDRTDINGFRCIRVLGEETDPSGLRQPVEVPMRDFSVEKPVSDEVFAHYRRLFDYDRTPLDARIEEERPTPDGIRQKISFRAAYGDDRMIAYLWLPSSPRPPYQVVVFFPGAWVIHPKSSEALELGPFEFLHKTGRAVLHPVYKGTFERGGELTSVVPTPTTFYRDHVVMWGKDLSRSIDYLETRDDLDTSRLAYYGYSWGGLLGAILPAVEQRIKVNIFHVAGMRLDPVLPEVDQLNYITRVRQPTLLVNSEMDYYFNYERAQRPFFALLGTPDEQKKQFLVPGCHDVPRTDAIRESLQWLDTHLGPVEQR